MNASTGLILKKYFDDVPCLVAPTEPRRHGAGLFADHHWGGEYGWRCRRCYGVADEDLHLAVEDWRVFLNVWRSALGCFRGELI